MWTLAVQNSETGCYTIAACFPFEPREKCMIFKDIYPGLSITLSFNFQDSPGPKWFSRTFQVLEFLRKKIWDLPGGAGTLSVACVALDETTLQQLASRYHRSAESVASSLNRLWTGDGELVSIAAVGVAGAEEAMAGAGEEAECGRLRGGVVLLLLWCCICSSRKPWQSSEAAAVARRPTDTFDIAPLRPKTTIHWTVVVVIVVLVE